MEYYFTTAKALLIGILSAVLSFLQPIGGDLQSMFLLFVMNTACGLLADITKGGRWNRTKIRSALFEAFLFFTFVTAIYVMGYLKHNMDGALQCVSWAVYIMIYYYGTNICRNIMIMLPAGSPGHSCFSFFYYFLSLEGVRRIPLFESYMQQKKEEKKDMQDTKDGQEQANR